jgi:hypothetical protein
MDFIPAALTIGKSLMGGNAKPLLFGSMFGGGKQQGTTDPTAADPFAPYRGAYAQQLNSFWNNPNSVTTDPGFQAQLQSGIGAVNAGMAASGQLASGGQMAALNQLGMNTYNQFRQQQLANLMQLSEASQNPAAGAMAMSNIGNMNYNQGRQNTADLLGGLGGLSGLFKSGRFGGGVTSSGANGGYDWQNDPDFLSSVGL